jgi:hypothetical protein
MSAAPDLSTNAIMHKRKQGATGIAPCFVFDSLPN